MAKKNQSGKLKVEGQAKISFGGKFLSISSEAENIDGPVLKMTNEYGNSAEIGRASCRERV